MWGSGEMADAHALGACALTGVWVRIPPSPPFLFNIKEFENYELLAMIHGDIEFADKD